MTVLRSSALPHLRRAALLGPALAALLFACAPPAPPPRAPEGHEARSDTAASTPKEGIPCASSESCIERAIKDFGFGRYALAAEHARKGLAAYPPKGDPERRRAVEELFAQAKGQIGILRFTVTPAEAELRVNDRRVEPGDNRDEVFVEAGDVRVEAAANGYAPYSNTVKIQKGGTAEVVITMKERTGPAPTASAIASGGPATPTIVPTGGPSTPLLLGGVAVTAASLGVGIGLVASGVDKADEAKRLQSKLLAEQGPKACAPPSPALTCNQIVDTARTSDLLGNSGIWTLIFAGVAGAATTAYGIVTRREAHSEPVKASIGIGPNVAAVSVHGNF